MKFRQRENKVEKIDAVARTTKFNCKFKSNLVEVIPRVSL